MRVTATRLAAAALACTLVAVVPAWAGAQGGIAAVWIPKHVQFVYRGITNRYTCNGLHDKVAELLSRLGTRNLEVRYGPCTPAFPGVTVKLQVLVPASKARSQGAGPIVRAHWQRVVLMRSSASLQEQGNCELMQQFKQRLLPLFTTRNIEYRFNCVPNQISFGTHLSAEVLMPDAKG